MKMTAGNSGRCKTESYVSFCSAPPITKEFPVLNSAYQQLSVALIFKRLNMRVQSIFQPCTRKRISMFTKITFFFVKFCEKADWHLKRNQILFTGSNAKMVFLNKSSLSHVSSDFMLSGSAHERSKGQSKLIADHRPSRKTVSRWRKKKKDVERNQKRLTFNGKWKSFNCELKGWWQVWLLASEVINVHCVFLPYNMLSF